MAAVIIIMLGLLVVGLVGGAFLFVRARTIFREQKNYERGLKMVPLLIHLPPISDDIDNNGRDIREITDENISRAQVLYNIIASTVQKGFKSKVYGQRHIAFEIVANKGFVHYYAAVPVALVPVVQQAVVSAYPSARLEEVAEHNIFSPVGRISGTIGGELVLKENYAYSIATYQDLKRDAMQSLLNALSTLEKEDGAGVQILFRPADPMWRKKASGIAAKKRKGKQNSKGFDVAKQLIAAPFKPPDDKPGDKKPDDKQLSSLEQSIVDSIDDKTRYPGFEVLIRVVASSNIAQRAQQTLNNVVATFALFDAPGKNGFKYVPARDIENFVTGYIMRFFPQENKQNILNVVELATIFHFPDQRNIPTSQLERQASKQVDGPRNVMDEGLLFGYNIFRGAKKAIRLSNNDRRRHVYVVGQTGTGKSTFLENLALQDMLDGKGFAFVDPHGDTAEKLLSMVPKERTEDVVYFCPADMEYPLGLNLFEFHSPEQKDFLIQEAINMLYKLYDPQRQGIIGPRYEHWFRNAALTLMSDPEGATFIDIPKLFTDNAYAAEKKKHVTDQTVLDFWNKEMAQTADFHKSEVLGWFVSKFGAFLSNEMMRNIIGQTKSSFNLREIMDNKKILLVNLSKGRTGDLNSKLLGMIFVMKFQAAAMSRASIPEEERVDFCLYVDEFQNFSTDSFAEILSEARKYRLNLIVANQFTTQLTDQIREAVFGNVGSIVAHRVGTADAEALVKVFQPVFDIDDLQRIPNYNAVMRMLINGVPTQPFSLADLPPLGNPNKQLGDALKQLSAAKYGRPKAVVEAEIFKRLESKEPAKPAVSAGSPFGRAAARAPATAGAPAANSFKPVSKTASPFLDDWLQKRATPTGGNPFSRPSAFTKQAPSSMPPSTPLSTPATASAPAAAQAAVAPAPAPPVQPVTANVAADQAVVPVSAAPAVYQSSQQPTVQQPAPAAVPEVPQGQPFNQAAAQAAPQSPQLAPAPLSGPTNSLLPTQPAAAPDESAVFDPGAPASEPPKGDFFESYMRKRASRTVQPPEHDGSVSPAELLAAELNAPAPRNEQTPDAQPNVMQDVMQPAPGPLATDTHQAVAMPPVAAEQPLQSVQTAQPSQPGQPVRPIADIMPPPTAEQQSGNRTKKRKKKAKPTNTPANLETGAPSDAPADAPADADASNPLESANVSSSDAPNTQLPQQADSSEVASKPTDSLEVDLRSGEPVDSDTIVIDQDGNLFIKEQAAADESKA